jgi:tetratricopeptide (TPR) repeat protein
MWKLSVKVGLAIFIASISSPSLFATGAWMPRSWIGERGEPIVAPPEFFWELEVKRIASEFTPPEKRVPAPPPSDQTNEEAMAGYRDAFTAKVDIAEFEAALKSGEVKSAHPDGALQAHKHTRQTLSGIAEGDKEVAEAQEEPSEFADYHRGALAMADSNLPEAKAAWEALLSRPAAERKYRSTWAAYMLGKLAIDEKRYADAVQHFQQCRQFAKDGFVDGLGLAAESYGWEAHAELESGHAEKSARLYLTQLALGDASAVVSLKFLVPDRDEVASFSDELQELGATVAVAYGVEKMEDALAKAAADPVLRQLVTAHVLAGGVDTLWENGATNSKPDPKRQARWLEAVAKAGAKDTPDAEHLGWVAYSMGKYQDAERWLKLSKGKTPAAQWLQAKLARRNGDLKLSASLMSEVVHGLPKNEELEASIGEGDLSLPSVSAWEDLGAIQLGRGEFLLALDSFMALPDMWDDAAYIAERVLTTKELLDYTEKKFPRPQPKEPKEKEAGETDYSIDVNARFRALVGRRLVREGRYEEAKVYLPVKELPHLERYIAALKVGNNEKTPKKERARALFTAAWVARYHGMEIMGTEGGPDSASDGGMSAAMNVAMERLTGQKQFSGFADEEEYFKPGPASTVIPVTAAEKKRLASTKLNPEKRYHYRHIAAGLAWKAASLLPDQSNEAADVLNTAGNWLKARFPKEADRFVQALERRCDKTEIGIEVLKKHWFADASGPWSEEEFAKDPPEPN